MITAVSGHALRSSATSPKELAKSYGSWTGIRTNHVISQAGSFFDDSGSSRGLSTKEDLELLIELRKHSDLVIVDAATARAEKYRKLTSTHLAIISASGNFLGIPAALVTEGVTFFSPVKPVTQQGQVLEHVVISLDDPFGELLSWAQSRQLEALLLEAGPTLTRLAFESNAVRQSAITITPGVQSEYNLESLNPFSKTGQLLSVAASEDATFTLWSY
jgi:riboflavin biosynthesis pyrimidine reductase